MNSVVVVVAVAANVVVVVVAVVVVVVIVVATATATGIVVGNVRSARMSVTIVGCGGRVRYDVCVGSVLDSDIHWR